MAQIQNSIILQKGSLGKCLRLVSCLHIFFNMGMCFIYFILFFFFSALKFHLHLISSRCSCITSLLGEHKGETYVTRQAVTYSNCFSEHFLPSLKQSINGSSEQVNIFSNVSGVGKPSRIIFTTQGVKQKPLQCCVCFSLESVRIK